MKTYRQFAEEMRFAVENTMLEEAGFGKYAKKRKSFQSLRDQKIQALRQRPEHWKGLE